MKFTRSSAVNSSPVISDGYNSLPSSSVALPSNSALNFQPPEVSRSIFMVSTEGTSSSFNVLNCSLYGISSELALRITPSSNSEVLTA